MSATVDLSALSPLVDALADAIAVRVGDKITDRPAVTRDEPDGYLNPDQAAAFIGNAPVSRIYDLVQQRKLTPHRDGRRLLFDRADLRAYVEASS